MENKFNITGAEAITLALIEEGVDTVFGYPGGNNLPIYDSFYTHENEIRHVLVRHEQGAVHAAEGYASANRKVGVCMVTSGPGATNLLTGIADAQLDSVPIVCITGQVVKPQLGYDAFQETDVVGFSMPVTKWNYQITSASEIASVMAKAFYIARSGRPGPVLLDITKDAQTQIIEKFEYKKCNKIRSYHPKLKPSETSINEAATLLNNAQRPLMVVGHGVLLSGCQNEVKELAEKLNMPVASTLLGLSSIENENPLFAGMVGLHGNYAANMMTNRCDVLLAVGMRFSDRVIGNPEKYANQAAVIHIEIDPSEVGKIISPAVGIVSDAKSALQKILPLIRKSSHISWLNQMKEFQAKENETVIGENLSKLRMGKAVRVVSEKKTGSTAVVADVGQNQMASARYFNFQEGDSIITSGGLGTMGFALPASIGAAYTKKFQNVVCIMGDGGFQMTIEELGTIMQYKLPVKILLLNNNYLGMIRQLQDLYYNSHYYFGEMQNPDFVKIVDAYGIKAEKVDSLEALDSAVKRMMDYNGAYFLEVRVEKQENIYPVIPAGKAVDEMLLTPNN
ncbi:MAG: biosynthetic-type acetolactate synthase large subunit [Bacteroidales bacterium]|jgi:acetolactate synthase-1/2/3 large subunit|nr:biosynthetic-type acetolactate synthase large subunit [Bacteroidales bacterium]